MTTPKTVLINSASCSVNGCIDKVYCKVLCKKHYARSRRHSGNPLITRNHGFRKLRSPEYTAWTHMKSRCYNKNNKDYHYYGGRGIGICDEWKNNFMSFFNDMGVKPEWANSIDRIDTNGNYEPGNCRWATHYTQVKNRRLQKSNKSGVEGVNQTKDGRWMARITIHGHRNYLGYFKNKESAVMARLSAEKEHQNV